MKSYPTGYRQDAILAYLRTQADADGLCRCSLNEIAQHAGLLDEVGRPHRPNAKVALAALERRGLVTKVQPARGRSKATWRLL